VRHVPSLQLSDQLELDVTGAERIEQAPPPAEQDRDEMDLHLVEQPRPQQRLRRAGPVHHHGTTARRAAVGAAVPDSLLDEMAAGQPGPEAVAVDRETISLAFLRDDVRLAISPQVGEWNGGPEVATRSGRA
jgi:hypothetical protein